MDRLGPTLSSISCVGITPSPYSNLVQITLRLVVQGSIKVYFHISGSITTYYPSFSAKVPISYNSSSNQNHR